MWLRCRRDRCLDPILEIPQLVPASHHHHLRQTTISDTSDDKTTENRRAQGSASDFMLIIGRDFLLLRIAEDGVATDAEPTCPCTVLSTASGLFSILSISAEPYTNSSSSSSNDGCTAVCVLAGAAISVTARRNSVPIWGQETVLSEEARENVAGHLAAIKSKNIQPCCTMLSKRDVATQVELQNRARSSTASSIITGIVDNQREYAIALVALIFSWRISLVPRGIVFS